MSAPHQPVVAANAPTAPLPRRVLITGGKGQLGRALQATYAACEAVAAPGHSDLDVTDWRAVRALVADVRPDLIIHAAAATNVDACESDIAGTFRVNTLGARHLAAAAATRDIPLVYVSTNYVFDGQKPQGEAYHEWDTTGPLSVYGHSKLAGEVEVRGLVPKHYVVRTAQVYAAEGRKFVQTMLRLANEGKTTIGGVADQWGQPTYAADLAAGIAALAATDAWGTYHLANAGACSWAGWAVEIFRLAGRDVAVEPIPASTFSRPATPPTNGVMHNWAAAALGIALPPWQDGLRRCLAEMGELRAG